MLKFIQDNIKEEIFTLFVIIFYILIKYLTTKIIIKFSNKSNKYAGRTQVILKYINILLLTISIVFIFIIWGVKTEHLAFAFSSIFAVIGVAMFAQWSLLSNVTAGIILYFTAPFHIGDIIKIHDKDFPYEAKIIEIKGFHIYLETQNGEIVVFPNNIFFTKYISILKEFSKELPQE